MKRALLFRPAAAASPYERWYQHFVENRRSRPALSWNDSRRLSPGECGTVARSIQQFQLGEWARGRGLMRRARSHPVLSADPWFLRTLELFIAEEQHHSQLLGDFLAREEIGRLNQHWLNEVFRRLRKLAGLEACVTVLVTAEALAIPYYQALRDATGSQLLRSICIRVLCDEVAHLNYQAVTLGLIRRPLSASARRIRGVCHSIFFRTTALILWQQHRSVFGAAGWDWRRFWKAARREFTHFEGQIRRAMMATGSANPASSAWLD